MPFRDWQPRYAAHGIATFPVRVGDDGKVPAIRGWQRVGLPGSATLAQRFADADAFGFCAGQRSGLTILDVDTNDERTLVDALDHHGHTQIIVRSGSGNYQAWYRWNGEKRQIRPKSEKPIDILGGGFVVAPPSRGINSNYQFIQGSLDNLDRLPVLRGIDSVNLHRFYRSRCRMRPSERAVVIIRYGDIACSRPTIATTSMPPRCSTHAKCRFFAAVDG